MNKKMNKDKDKDNKNNKDNNMNIFSNSSSSETIRTSHYNNDNDDNDNNNNSNNNEINNFEYNNDYDNDDNLNQTTRSRQHSYGSGWGMYVPGNFEERSIQVRDAWLSVTETSSYSYGRYNNHSRHHSTIQILYVWRNPNPSVSFKSLANDENFPSDPMELSCYIDGFRIVQYSNGEIKAEFCIAFTYGSISYLSWKSYSEFVEYYNTLNLIHRQIKPIFPNTMREWENLQSRKKWFRCLSVSYLKEKSILLGRVVQQSLLECPTPGLLLEFIKSKRNHTEIS